MISDNLNNNFIFIYKIIIIIVIIVGVVGYLLYNNVFQTITTVAISDEENDLLNSYRGSNESFSNIEKFYNEGDKLCDINTEFTKDNFFQRLEEQFQNWNGEKNDIFIKSGSSDRSWWIPDVEKRYYKEFQILFFKDIILEMLQDSNFNKDTCTSDIMTKQIMCDRIINPLISNTDLSRTYSIRYIIYKVIIIYKNNNPDNLYFKDLDSEKRNEILKYLLPLVMFSQAGQGKFLTKTIHKEDGTVETDLEQIWRMENKNPNRSFSCPDEYSHFCEDIPNTETGFSMINEFMELDKDNSSGDRKNKPIEMIMKLSKSFPLYFFLEMLFFIFVISLNHEFDRDQNIIFNKDTSFGFLYNLSDVEVLNRLNVSLGYDPDENSICPKDDQTPTPIVHELRVEHTLDTLVS